MHDRGTIHWKKEQTAYTRLTYAPVNIGYLEGLKAHGLTAYEHNSPAHRTTIEIIYHNSVLLHGLIGILIDSR